MILRRLAVPLALIAGALIAGPQVARANPPVSFTGTVVNIDNAMPLAGVTVTMRSDKGYLIAKAVTDAKGSFAVFAPTSGTVALSVEKPGYGACYSRFDMDDFGQLAANVRIAPIPAKGAVEACDGTLSVTEVFNKEILQQ